MGENVIKSFDYLFIGMGAANSLLLLKMHQYNLLTGKKIAIIEPNDKLVNDRNFCFWSTPEELQQLNLSQLVSSKWQNIQVADREIQNIAPNYYYHVRGIDLYNKVREIHSELGFQYFPINYSGNPKNVSNAFEIAVGNSTISANKVFDSRPPQFNIAKKYESHLLQSFYGWEIKTVGSEFDTSSMVMMDFNIPQNNFCQFMYVLPFTNNTALFEVTRFGKEKITETEANDILAKYLSKYSFSYEIIDKEKGVIPMSSLEIANDNDRDNWIVTGAKANMIKPTTGYAFHNMAIDADIQVKALINNESHIREQKRPRFKFYDNLLLKILEETPQNGEKIFRNLFNQIPINKVFTFLSEKSFVTQELKIFSKLPILLFLKAAFKELFHRFCNLSPTYLAAFSTIVFLSLFALKITFLPWLILGIGFLTVGLSHGALDHLATNIFPTKKHFVKFIIVYLLKGSLLGLLWLVLPELALFVFILFSAWHFGQADFKEWNYKEGVSTMLWGIMVLGSILLYHFNETIAVLKQINGLNVDLIGSVLTGSQLMILQVLFGISSLIYALIFKSKFMFSTLLYLILGAFLPLVVSFGIYFVLQHSMHGWNHLRSELNLSSFKLWMKSLPFSIGGALIFAIFILMENQDYIGLFFIVLSCISLPHVLSMHHFYARFRGNLDKSNMNMNSALMGKN
jgi:lycopene beta-cyclase